MFRISFFLYLSRFFFLVGKFSATEKKNDIQVLYRNMDVPHLFLSLLISFFFIVGKFSATEKKISHSSSQTNINGVSETYLTKKN